MKFVKPIKLRRSKQIILDNTRPQIQPNSSIIQNNVVYTVKEKDIESINGKIKY